MFDQLIGPDTAAPTPTHPAIITSAGVISYRRLNEAVNATATALSPSVIGKNFVVIDEPDLVRHWLLTLAMGRLGVLSASTPPGRAAPDTLGADLILTHAGSAVATANSILLDDQWWNLHLSQAGAAPAVPSQGRQQDAGRLVVSSGTTGTPKKVLFSNQTIQRRIELELKSGLIGPVRSPDTRFLISMGPSTMGGFLAPLDVWSLGGTVLFGWDPVMDIEKLIALNMTCFALSTGQLQTLVKSWPRHQARLDNLAVVVGGSQLSDQLAAEAMRKLSPNLQVAYGTTEAGLIASGAVRDLEISKRVVGKVLPWVDLEIVDDADQPVPIGEQGRVRVRGHAVIANYLGEDPPPDGWLYPGDIGVLDERQHLRLLGRELEVINVGGSKYAPEDIENVLRTCPGVADIAAFALTDQHEIQTPAVAIVRTSEFDPTIAKDLVRKSVFLDKLAVFYVDSLPRNAMGKVERAALARQFSERGRSPAS